MDDCEPPVLLLQFGLSVQSLTPSSARYFTSCNRWRYLIAPCISANIEGCTLATTLHAVEYAPTDTHYGLSALVPIRFHGSSKLHNHENLLLGFDAAVLSKCLECSLSVGKIVYGYNDGSREVLLSSVSGDVCHYVKKIVTLLSSSTAPELLLNRHCPECEFQRRCHQKALEIDELSLLSGMSERERTKHRRKGIFTVHQLSYTFRPRRRPKRAKKHAKLHNFALRALAIRERTIYIQGPIELPGCTTKIYLDIEGLPDRNFHYLIGALIVTAHSTSFHSFWANEKSDEPSIFRQLANVIEQHPHSRVFHYGSYDAIAIKRVARSLPTSEHERFAAILANSVNVLSLFYPSVYFPAYSASLKDISGLLEGRSSDQYATGLDAIVWRMKWEQARDPEIQTRLVDYNKADCISLMRLVDFVNQQVHPTTQQLSDSGLAIRRVENLISARPHWQLFAVKPYALDDLKQVSKAAYFDYQRERVLFRTDANFKKINRRARHHKRVKVRRPNKLVSFEAIKCSFCRSRFLTRYGESSHDVLDLKFTKSGVRKHVTRFVSWRYKCGKCNLSLRSEDRLPNPWLRARYPCCRCRSPRSASASAAVGHSSRNRS
jgi:predicted RecB family nuclease